MIRASLVLLIVVAALGLAVAQQTTPPAPVPAESPARTQIETDLRLERRLLLLDLAAYREARDRERRARDVVNGVAGRLDQALAGDAVALGTLEGLHDELSTTRAAADTAAERVDYQLLRLQDRLRQIGFLESELGGRPAVRADPVTGRWRVRVAPQDRAGVFSLRLEGAVVTGTYQMDGGASGSFRGTFNANVLRLERIDATRGFDATFTGTVRDGRVSGIWTANELASGEPAQGAWTAIRESEQP
jgi:hypothetical protein